MSEPVTALKHLVKKSPLAEPEYSGDVLQMKAALNRAGYDASESDIRWAWEQHSEDWAAGWLAIESCGDYNNAVKYLLEYLVEA